MPPSSPEHLDSLSPMSAHTPQTLSPGIETLLQELSSEGDRDSAGVFTIDEKVAKRKLAAFQLPTAESWILVLVQAAHRGRATDIKVTQSARESVIQISGAAPWTWPQLQAVLDGEATTDGALLAYAVVVRALSVNEELTSFRVKAPDGTSALWRDGQLKLDRNRIEDVLLEEKTVFEVSHLGSFPESRSTFFEVRRSARAELAALRQALMTSCFASAVPLNVDGLEIPGIHLGDPPPPYHTRVPLALLPVGDYRIPSTPFSAALTSTKAVLLDQAAISDTSKSLDPKNSVSALACLSVVQKSEKSSFRTATPELAPGATVSRLLWVQDGVVVGSHSLRIPGNLELTLLLSAAGLKTDLTGLDLIKNQELLARRQIVVKQVGETLRELAEQSQEHDGKFFGCPPVQAVGDFPSLQSIFGRFVRGNLDPPFPVYEAEALQRDLRLLPDRLLEAFE